MRDTNVTIHNKKKKLRMQETLTEQSIKKKKTENAQDTNGTIHYKRKQSTTKIN